MSDFVGRIAARAVGDAVLAQPRVRGLFEDQSAPGAGFEVLDEEISAPARPQPAPKAPVPTAEGSMVPAPPPEAPAPRTRHARTRAPEERLTPARPQRSEARAVSPEPPQSTEPARERRSEPAAPVTVVESVAPAVRAGVALPPPPAPAVRVEPPVVRVHIGRLEVRANVHEPAREESRAGEPQPQGLTLSEYLRGRRESA
jgi:hypothetical protein